MIKRSITKLIIDTDPGVDDAHALLMALSTPQVTVEAITTVAGNVSLEKTTRNALTVLTVLDKNVPVYAGCADSLVAFFPKRAISHGDDGLGDSHFPLPERQAEPEHAVNAIIRLANQFPGDLTLVALGPLTNIAAATIIDPSLPSKIKKLIILGGAIEGKGNSWKLAAEFNFSIDPEAVHVVLEKWNNIILVPFEMVEKNRLTKEELEELKEIHTPKAHFFFKIFQNRIAQQLPLYNGVNEPDPLAMAVAINEGVITRAEHKYVTVELHSQITRGQSVVDWFDLLGCPPNVQIVLGIDHQAFFSLLKKSLMGTP